MVPRTVYNSGMVLLTAILAAGMALAHLFSYKLLFLQGIPRSPWLSMAGGSR